MPITVLGMRIAARRRHGTSAVHPNGVEALQRRLDRLNLERQSLRAQAVDADELERNRLEIVAAQWNFSHALIERYLPSTHRNAA